MLCAALAAGTVACRCWLARLMNWRPTPLTARHITPDELARLRTAIPALQERCTVLGRYNLPDCLVHGDLHLGNVARNGDSYQIFDWSDSCIAHPFVDMIEPYFSTTIPLFRHRCGTRISPSG